MIIGNEEFNENFLIYLRLEFQYCSMEVLLKIIYDCWYNINYIFFYYMVCKKKKEF